MALTATASPKTQLEITESLCLNNPVVISGSLNRPNIFLSASSMNGLHKDLDGVIYWLGNADVKSIPKTLIFTQTKNTACRVYSLLSKAAYKASYVTMYHASLTSTTKFDIRKSFQKEDGGMDIPDIEFVIVYGVPDTMSQLHQLYGRAGRSGCTSRAHLFYNRRQKNVHEDIQKFCVDKENCRRIAVLKSMGSDEEIRNGPNCCDVCSSIPDSLSLHSKAVTVQQKRRTAKRHNDNEVEKQLNEKLLQEREAYLQEHPNYMMIGIDFICSNTTIDDICKNSRFITSEDNLSTTYTQLRKRLFLSIKDILHKSPPPRKIKNNDAVKSNTLREINNNE